MNKKLLLISFDAVSDDDLGLLYGMPNFALLKSRGTLVTGVNSVFISNTYPAHVSVVTGCHPNRHGVVENCLFQPGHKKPEWYWYSKYIKVPTLFDRARAAGLTTCSVLWPVTAGADITFNMPEIFAADGTQGQLTLSMKYGNKSYTAEMFIHRGFKLLKGINRAALDDFSTAAAACTIVHKKPDFLMVHLTDVDNVKHRYGPGAPQTGKALERMDRRLGMLLGALRKAKLEGETSVIVFGDHSCLPVHTALDLNKLIPLPKSAAFHHAGGTAFLRVGDPGETGAALRAVTRFLNTPDSGASRLVSPEEMSISGLDRDFVLGVEADEGFCFGKAYRGQHGYTLRHEKYRTFYLASGQGVGQGAALSGGAIIDICPLAVKLLGLAQWDMDGVLRVPVSE